MKRIYFTALFIFLLVVSGCGMLSEELGFIRPEIISVYPSHLANRVTREAVITIGFSHDMDREKTSAEFCLSSPSGPVEGSFIWSDGKTLRFTPRLLLSEYHMYTITVGAGAEDTRGNDLEKTYASVFYTNDDRTPPRIVSHEPLNDALGIPPGQAIVITFSEPLNIDTVLDGITFAPAVEGRFGWDPLHTSVTFTPLYGFSYGTTCTVTMNTGITDVNGNNLEESYCFNFTVGDDFTPPAVSAVYQEPAGAPWDIDLTAHGIEKDLPLMIVFSEPVRRETLGSISLSPSAGFYLESPPVSSTVRLVFTAPLESETLYRLFIPSSVADIQNNRLDGDCRFFFYTDGPGSIRPVISALYDPHLGRNWAPDALETLTFPAPPSRDYAGIVIFFSGAMDPASVSADLSIAAGSPALGPKVVHPRWNAAFTELTLDLHGLDSAATYRFRIKGGSGGARDVNGNCLKEDYRQYIRF